METLLGYLTGLLRRLVPGKPATVTPIRAKPAETVTSTVPPQVSPKSTDSIPTTAVPPPAVTAKRGDTGGGPRGDDDMPSMVQIALQEYGTAAAAGDANNPRILEYLRVAGLSSDIKDDETAWCGTFVSYCAVTAGYKLPAGNAGARNWLKFGTEATDPKMGDVVVFWRESKDSWKGHVAILIRRQGDIVYVLGGNQGRQVSIVGMPTDRVLGYRRPV